MVEEVPIVVEFKVEEIQTRLEELWFPRATDVADLSSRLQAPQRCASVLSSLGTYSST